MEGIVPADQILARELEKMGIGNQQPNTENKLNEAEIYQKLAAPFPKEAYSSDTSRGFALTSLKAQYVRERLNEVLGIMNWTFGGEYKEVDGGIIYLGALVITVNGKQNKFFAPGYSANKKNLGDAYKGANTDSLCKCASNIGVGNDVFKGLVDPATLEKKGSVVKPATSAAKSESKPAPFKTRARRSKPKAQEVMMGDDI